MIRSELVTRLAAQNPHLYEKDCEAVVSAVLARIEDALVAGDRVEIRGFGAFSTKDIRARQGRNPRTGESVLVAEKKAVQFRPGKGMRQRLKAMTPDALPASRRVG
ncbi:MULTISPECIES: HU family DNA-binding protein [Methylorubrum]|jgi:integration host factor subunit beta|nr:MULTISPECIES: HU family DNA-binding protein [Bacteria]MBL7405297.1 integration host factor subunit beta [Escherichia coli]MDV2988275.1 HU family DNA-binding protein [Methylobacteriaceae bacterium AG10]MBD8907761.1 integration host factor subunit beta [Methylorubrum zatmanii]MCP1546678.1 integration host factor subunit beta [Methylorubrum extorquens]MCP1592015.1 integration host factor subunit beta [Methylorubrum extorquens]